MCSQNQSLLCRFGFHRWTFEISQGSDELQATQEWYCTECQIDRFDEAWFPTTRIDRWKEAIHTPFAKLHYRIQDLLYRPPPTQYATTSQRSKTDHRRPARQVRASNRHTDANGVHHGTQPACGNQHCPTEQS